MKKSNIIRGLLVFMAISSPSMAAIYSARTAIDSAAPDLYAFKPLDVIFPGFLQPDLRQRPEGYRGFSGFVQEVRNAVRSTGGAPRKDPDQDTSFAEDNAESQTADTTYESSIPIKLRQNSRTGDTAEVYLGFSVRQIVKRIPSPGTITGERPANSVGRNRQQANPLSSASTRRGSLSSGNNWLSGGFLSTGNLGGFSGFGFNLRPLAYPNDLGNGPYSSPQSTEFEDSKGLIALGKMVLDLVFNPFVYFSVLIVSLFVFMARFRGPVA